MRSERRGAYYGSTSRASKTRLSPYATGTACSRRGRRSARLGSISLGATALVPFIALRRAFHRRRSLIETAPSRPPEPQKQDHEKEIAQPPESQSQDRNPEARKHIYFFGGGKAEGNKEMKNLLGGKGANLAEMTKHRCAGSAWLHHHHRGVHRILRHRPASSPKGLRTKCAPALPKWKPCWVPVWRSANPLLVSVRSGARASMPGMMDTILQSGSQRRDRQRVGPGVEQ